MIENMHYKNKKWPIIFLLLIICLYYYKSLNYSKILFGIDLNSAHLYRFIFLKNYFFQHFLFPLWDPYTYSGVPLVQNIHNLYFSPFILLFLIFPVSFAYNMTILLHLILSGYFMFRLCKSLSLSNSLSILGVIIFIFNGRVANFIFAGHNIVLYAYCYIPASFYYLLKIKTQKKYFFYLSIILSLQVLVSQPQIWIYSLFYNFLYIFFDDIFSKKINFSRLFYFILSLVLCFIICFPYFYSNLIFLKFSERTVKNVSEFIFAFSLPIKSLITVILPNFFGSVLNSTYFGPSNPTVYWEYTNFIGLLPIILLFFIKFKKNKSFIILLIISLLLSLGKNFPLNKYIYPHLPALNLFRGPSRHMFFFIFFISLLAPIGLKNLTKLNFPSKRYLNIACLFFIFISIIIYSTELLNFLFAFLFNIIPTHKGAGFYSDKIPIISFQIKVFLLSHLSIFFLLFFFKKKKTILIPIIFLVPIYYVYSMGFIKNKDIKTIISSTEILKKLPSTYSRYITAENWPEEKIFTPEASMIYKKSSAEGYDPYIISQYSKCINILSKKNIDKLPAAQLNIDYKNQFLLNLLNIKYIISKKGVSEPDMHLFFKNNSYYIYQFGNADKQGAYFVENIITKQNPITAKDLFLLKTQPKKSVIMSFKDYQKLKNIDLSMQQANESIKLITYNSNAIIFKIKTNKPRLFYLPEIYYPIRKCYIDDNRVIIYKANYIFSSVIAPKGEHIIRFDFSLF